MRSIHKALAVPLAAAVLAGCSFIPKYERPPAPVPAAFPYPSATDGTPAAALDWHQFLVDPKLRELVTIALADNRDLRVAVLNMQQARAQYDIRVADRFPTIGLGVNASRAPSTSNGNQVSSYQVGLALST
ncbi:MAG TPA: TolC family protein, partial [Ramlibacter sp.]